MYKYKDKEFEIIEMTHEDSPLNWSLPRLERPYIIGTDTGRGRYQRDWDQFWRDHSEGFSEVVNQGSGFYQQLRDIEPINIEPINFEHINREVLERTINEIFTVSENTPRITRRRRSGMVEIQRTIGIP